MNNNIIHIENLYKGFGEKDYRNEVIKGLSLDIKEGDFFSIMGPSGCGKSTLLYLINGLDKPDNGSIEICEQDISKLSDKEMSIIRRQKLGFVFQFYNLVPNLTVEENIFLPLIMDKKSPKQYSNRLDQILSYINISSKLKCFPKELSGGLQQKVAIARALMINPQILLADEPTGNLDEESSIQVMEIFKKINAELNVSILQVTHNQNIANFSNKILTMKNGILL